MSKKRKHVNPVPAQPEEKKESKWSPFSKVMVALIVSVMVVVMIFTLLDGMGLHLLWPEIISVGSALVPVLLLFWGAVGIYNRIRSEKAQRIYRIVGLSLGMGLAAFVLVAAAQLTMYAMPHAYGTIKSPAGQKVVILRLNDVGAGTDEDYAATIARMNARVEYLNGKAAANGETEANPDAETAANSEAAVDAAVALESYPMEAYGYVYLALPKKMGIFYTSNVVVEGEIYRGDASESGLFFEWLDDDTVRFYLENPEPGDEGEMILHLNPEEK